MAKLANILNKDKDALLFHPVVGFVRWAKQDSKDRWIGGMVRTLFWATGPEKDQTLIVDDTVLWCDQWKMATEEQLQEFIDGD